MLTNINPRQVLTCLIVITKNNPGCYKSFAAKKLTSQVVSLLYGHLTYIFDENQQNARRIDLWKS